MATVQSFLVNSMFPLTFQARWQEGLWEHTPGMPHTLRSVVSAGLNWERPSSLQYSNGNKHTGAFSLQHKARRASKSSALVAVDKAFGSKQEYSRKGTCMLHKDTCKPAWHCSDLKWTPSMHCTVQRTVLSLSVKVMQQGAFYSILAVCETANSPAHSRCSCQSSAAGLHALPPGPVCRCHRSQRGCVVPSMHRELGSDQVATFFHALALAHT
eukprot:1149509-Pelagomonas_calceolata.AAC.2